MTTDRTFATLQKIAEMLGVPVSAFFESDPAAVEEPVAEAWRQTTELLHAFARVEDPQARRDCIAFVRAQKGPRLL